MKPFARNTLQAGLLAIAFGPALAAELPGRDDYAYGFGLATKNSESPRTPSAKP